MELSQNLLDKIKQEAHNMNYGRVVLNISPKNVILEITKRLFDDNDDYTASEERPVSNSH